MAKTLLNWTNEVLKRTNHLTETNLLSTLSDSGKQVFIDTAVQAANEILDDLYTGAGKPLPNILGESSITLVDADRDYALAADLVQLLWPMLDETNGRILAQYEPGYHQLIIDQKFPSHDRQQWVFYQDTTHHQWDV